MVECIECGLLFINPQPEPEVLKEYYPKDYYSVSRAHFREYSRFRKRMMEEYFGYAPSSRSSETTRLFRKVILLPFRVWYGWTIPFVQGGHLLDVGCASGTELYKLRAMGWNTYGVEMDRDASEQARSKGLSVFTGTLFEANFPDQFFHVVRRSFVLEHLPNPRETLAEIKRILRPQGRLYISVQNARSLNYRLFGRRWYSLDIPRHLFSFDPKNLQRLISSLNLEVKRVRFSSGTRTFLTSLQYCMNERYREGSRTGSNRSISGNHFLRQLSRLFCWVVDRARWGDLIHLEVAKP